MSELPHGSLCHASKALNFASPWASFSSVAARLPACLAPAPCYNQITMAIVIRAHFDGKVIVPDEPVEIPVGPLEVEIRLKSGALPPPGDALLSPEEAERRLAAWDALDEHLVSGLNIPDEALRRENLYEPDRGL